MHKVAILALTLAIVRTGAARAEEKYDPEARAKAIAPYVDNETVAVGHADMTRDDVAKMMDRVAVVGSSDPTEVERRRQDIRKWIDRFTKAGGREIYSVYGLSEFPNNPPFLIIPMAEGVDGERLLEVLEKTGQVVKKLDGVVFCGSQTTLDRLGKFKPKSREGLAKGFAAAGDTSAQLVLMPSADTRRVIEESIPTLPQALGGEKSKVVTRGVMWSALGATGPPNMSLNIVIQSQDADAAARFKDFLTRFLDILGKQENVTEVVPDFAKLAAQFIPEVAGDRLTLKVDDQTLNAALVPAFKKAQASSSLMASTITLRQIGLAMHGYHDVYKSFPMAANYDKVGKPLLSWRVHILPYIEQEALYKQFHLDEPWDSEHNRKLIAKMPALYRINSKLTSAGKTTFLGIAGKEAMFPGNKPLTFKDITDGTSNTAWVVEAGDSLAVEWTKPEDFNYDPKNPMASLEGRFKGKIPALFVDGSVRVLPTKISAKTLNALFTRAGGEVVGNDF